MNYTLLAERNGEYRLLQDCETPYYAWAIVEAIEGRDTWPEGYDAILLDRQLKFLWRLEENNWIYQGVLQADSLLKLKRI